MCIVGALVLVIGLPFACYGFYRTPYITRQEVTLHQPVPFSHKHYVGGLGIDCRYCHRTVEDHAFAGLPATQVCMTCHSQLWTQAPLLAPLRQSYTDNNPVQWNRVNHLPDFVFFNHGIHVHAGVACFACHGRVDQMPLMYKARPLTMQWCTSCHRAPEKYIGDRAHVFDMPPPPVGDPETTGRARVAMYHIDVHQLINCTMCHR